MIHVYIPTSLEFRYYKDECRVMYEAFQEEIHDINSFDFIINNTFFYLFVNNTALIGCIYYFVDEAGKLFFNGFANRKMHLLNLECLKMSLDWFNDDIYAIAQNRKSALCLLRCGFVRNNGNEFVYIKTHKTIDSKT